MCHQQVFALGRALHADAARDELLRGQLAALVVVQQGEDLPRVVHGEVDHLQLVVDLGLLDGALHLSNFNLDLFLNDASVENIT